MLNRIPPALPTTAMMTYQILAPVGTHYRPASCAEVECRAHLHGWRTIVDETTDLGARQAHYVRNDRTRGHTETREAGLTVFTFGPGQHCFEKHRARLDRPEIYLVREGDWRGNPRGTEPRRHTRAEDWVDDFATHQQQLADRIERG